MTGSFDPELNLLYWGIGNPGPDWNGDVRKGDNLYSDSVVALNPDNGRLQWYFQFTPHDLWDYDAVQIPVLVDMEFGGRERKLMLWGNRNGFFYVLDRTDGRFLLGKAFAHQTWAEGPGRKRKAHQEGWGRTQRGGHPDLPQRPGCNQLVLSLLQPQNRAFLPVCLGNTPVSISRATPPTFEGNAISEVSPGACTRMSWWTPIRVTAPFGHWTPRPVNASGNTG